MERLKIKKGLNIPIAGEPEQKIYEANKVETVAIIGDDFVGMKPTIEVAVGDKVKLGQVLFSDKKNSGVKFTSPGAGQVLEINRGEKRHFESIVIKLDEKEDEIKFKAYPQDKLQSLSGEDVKKQLIESGLWPSFRTRPFSKTPAINSEPSAIFINTMDTQPLAADTDKIWEINTEQFINGLLVISNLTNNNIYLCKRKNSKISSANIPKITEVEIEGPHPAGNVGTHIHFLSPVNQNKTVWHIGLQDVISIGILFTTGKINVERIISLGGSSVKKPRLIKTRLGSNLKDLLADEIIKNDNRIISGSVLTGRKAHDTHGYLGKFHQQVSVIPEGRERKLLGWFSPGINLHSIKNIVLTAIMPNKKLSFTTSQNGGERAIVPVGSYETVMPLDIMPTFLLKSLAVQDIETAESLGCLELDEEDLALCSYVCPSKIDHGKNLRKMLTLIEKEG